MTSARQRVLVGALLAAASACASTAPPPAAALVQVVGAWQAHLGVDDHGDDDRVFTELPDQGFRLLDVSGYALGEHVHYASLWGFAELHGWEERRGLDAEALVRANADAAARGMVVARVNAFDVAGQARFAAVWELGDPRARTLRLDVGLEQLEHLAATEHVVDLAGYVVGGEERFVEIVAPRAEADALAIDVHPTLDGAAFDALIDELAAKGGRPLRIAAQVIDGAPRFTVLTSITPGSLWIAARDLDAEAYRRRVEDLVVVGYRTTQLTAYVLDERPRFAVTWMQ